MSIKAALREIRELREQQATIKARIDKLRAKIPPGKYDVDEDYTATMSSSSVSETYSRAKLIRHVPAETLRLCTVYRATSPRLTFTKRKAKRES